ncbi:hypothetical protein FQN57_007332 [Myotisia sp. PD_48]|nr:hypothetical protein FQN57_007332 [Myotisia sp. PD_48]
MSVRKAHNTGKNHLKNVVQYYQGVIYFSPATASFESAIGIVTEIGHEKAQSVIDSITSSYAAEGQASANPMLQAQQLGNPTGPFGFPGRPGSIPPPFGMPGAPGAPPGMMPPPTGRGMPFPPPPPFAQGAGIPGPGEFPPNLANMPPNMPPMGNLPFPPPPPGGFPPNFQFPPPGPNGTMPPLQFPPGQMMPPHPLGGMQSPLPGSGPLLPMPGPGTGQASPFSHGPPPGLGEPPK